MTAGLAIDGLSVETADHRRLLDGVSLAVGRGEILGLVGPSGAGKSTLALAVLKLLPPALRQVAGRIRLAGTALDGLDERGLRSLRGRRIGLIVQDANDALDPLQRVATQLREVIGRHLALSGAGAQARASAALAAAGIAAADEVLGRYPHQLSGGLRQRVAIALAIAPAPWVLIADEPVSSVDVMSRRVILDRLKRLARDDGLAILLITHDPTVIAAIADRVGVLHGGRLVEVGSVASVLARPRQPLTRALLGRAAPPSPPPSASAFAGGAGSAITDRAAALVAVRRWLAAGGEEGDGHQPLLCLEGVSRTFAPPAAGAFGLGRRLTAVDGVCLHLNRGEVFGLVGESGSGKSTLARLIAGLDASCRGRILFAGWAVSPAALRRRRADGGWPIQMLFQDPGGSLNPRLTAGEAIAEMIQLRRPRLPPDGVRNLTRDLLACVGLPPAAASRRPATFSGGEKQRIALARALAARPRLLICDEPTSALDPLNQAAILDLLAELSAGLGLAILFISHDLTAVRRLCGRIGVMRAGRLCEVAPTPELFAAPRHPYARQLMALVAEAEATLAARSQRQERPAPAPAVADPELQPTSAKGNGR